MKANFIHTWSVESEFVIKNSIFPWKSELSWIWQFFFRKLDLFWLFLSTLVLLQNWASVFCNQSCQCARVLKNSPIFSKNTKFMLTLMSKEKLNFLSQIQILHFKCVWNLPSLSQAFFSSIIFNFGQCGWRHAAMRDIAC